MYNKIIERVNSLDPVKYASNRNFINGNVSKLSPYISRGVISTKTIFNQLIKSGYEISQIQKSLGDGNCEDYPRYQQMVGSITGLNMAIAITKNVYKTMIDGDEDEST